jgi:hypothetical protein
MRRPSDSFSFSWMRVMEPSTSRVWPTAFLTMVGRYARQYLALGMLVLQREDAGDVPALGRRLVPAGDALGDLVHEADREVAVRGDDPLVDGVQDRREQPLLLVELVLDAVLVERDVDRGIELSLLEGLENVAEGLDFLGPLEGLFVGIGGEEDDRDPELPADLLGRLDTVHAAREHDVHEDDVGPALARQGDGLLAVARHPDDGVAEALQSSLQVECDDFLVFDDQYVLVVHRDVTWNYRRCSELSKARPPLSTHSRAPFRRGRLEGRYGLGQPRPKFLLELQLTRRRSERVLQARRAVGILDSQRDSASVEVEDPAFGGPAEDVPRGADVGGDL